MQIPGSQGLCCTDGKHCNNDAIEWSFSSSSISRVFPETFGSAAHCQTSCSRLYGYPLRGEKVAGLPCCSCRHRSSCSGTPARAHEQSQAQSLLATQFTGTITLARNVTSRTGCRNCDCDPGPLTSFSLNGRTTRSLRSVSRTWPFSSYPP